MDFFRLSLAVFAVLGYSLLQLRLGRRQLQQLSTVPDELPAHLPKVSVVFSPLDEAATIEPALRLLLALDHPEFEIVAVDDRSTDGMSDTLERLALLIVRRGSFCALADLRQAHAAAHGHGRR